MLVVTVVLKWLLDIHAVSLASGCLTVQKASRTRRAPRKHLESTSGKPLRHRTLQLSNSWAENPTLRRAARVPPPPWPGCSTLLRAARDPLQPWPRYSTLTSCVRTEPSYHSFRPRLLATSSGVLFGSQNVCLSGSSSSAAIQLLLPTGVTAAIAEGASERQQRAPKRSSLGNSGKKSGTRVVSDAARNALNTRVQSWQWLFWARVVWKCSTNCFCMLWWNGSRRGAYIALLTASCPRGDSFPAAWLAKPPRRNRAFATTAQQREGFR